jgi:hypothetical protein
MSRQYLLRAQLGPWIEFDVIYALLNMTSPFVLLQASRYVYCMYIHVGDHVRSLCVYDVCIKEKRSSGEERSAFPQKKKEKNDRLWAAAYFSSLMCCDTRRSGPSVNRSNGLLTLSGPLNKWAVVTDKAINC